MLSKGRYDETFAGEDGVVLDCIDSGSLHPNLLDT